MGSVFGYIHHRGTIPFDKTEPNKIDALILSQLAYIPFENIIPEEFNRSVTLSHAAKLFLNSENKRVIWKNDPRLIEEAGNSRRFGGIKLSVFVNRVSRAEIKQFSAVTFEINPSLHFIAFRGTDHTVTGWEEDFTLYSRSVLPSQRDARVYFKSAFLAYGGDFILGGHSKGGNLALYTVDHCDKELKNCIKAVYNFDGPSLDKEMSRADVYTFIPQASFFGIMLTRGDNFAVIKSRNNSFNQHDITSWEINGSDFVYAEKRSEIGLFMERAFNDFVSKLSKREREALIDSLFKIFHKTNKTNFDDIIQNPSSLAVSFSKLNKKERSIVLKSAGKALKSAGSNIFNKQKR